VVRIAIKRIPALFYVFFIGAGIIFSHFTHLSIITTIFVLLVNFFIILILHIFLKRRYLFLIDIILIFSLFLCGAIMLSVRDAVPYDEHVSNVEGKYCGIVLDNPEAAAGNVVLKVRLVDEKDGCFLPAIVKIYVQKFQSEIGYGDVVLFYGVLKKARGVRNPGGFDYASYLKRRSVDYISYIKPDNILYVAHIRGNPFFQKLILPLKIYCIQVISHNLKGTHRALLEGLTLGIRGEIPQELKQVFSNAGVVHILAVSGLHVGIISFFLFILLRSLRFSFNTSIVISCFFLIIYGFLTGLRAPVVRSTIMFVFIMLGLLSQKRIILANLIALSAIIILALDPTELFDAGFQLSYAATFSIVFFNQKIYNIFPLGLRKQKLLRNFILLPFSVSLAAQLGTAPIVAYYFFKLPLAASIANLVVVPLVSLAIPTGFLSMAGAAIHPVIAKVLTGANWIFLDFIIKISNFFSSIPYLLVRTGRPSIPFLLIYYPGIFLLFFLKGIKRIKFIVFASLLVLNIFVFSKVWSICHPVLSINFFDVSEGDASFLEFPNGVCCLVDGGRRSAYVDYGEKVITQFLHSKGINKINTVIATHPDVDHYGGLIAVIENFQVDRLLINGSEKLTFLYTKLLETAKKKEVPVFNIHRGEVLWIGYYPLYVLNPPILKGCNLPSNEGSIVFKFGYGDITFLFTGDFPNRILKLPSALLPSTVLKFPHHGARLTDEREFLSVVHPEVTTISVGEGNFYGHPAKENLAILDSLKSKVYRTDRDGAIIFRTDGKEIWTKTMVK